MSDVLGEVIMVGQGNGLARAECVTDADAYRICQKRGHKANYNIGPWSVCGWCGVHYKWELIEQYAPKGEA